MSAVDEVHARLGVFDVRDEPHETAIAVHEVVLNPHLPHLPVEVGGDGEAYRVLLPVEDDVACEDRLGFVPDRGVAEPELELLRRPQHDVPDEERLALEAEIGHGVDGRADDPQRLTGDLDVALGGPEPERHFCVVVLPDRRGGRAHRSRTVLCMRDAGRSGERNHRRCPHEDHTPHRRHQCFCPGSVLNECRARGWDARPTLGRFPQNTTPPSIVSVTYTERLMASQSTPPIGPWRRLWPYLSRYRQSFVLGAFSIVTGTAIQVSSPWVLKRAIDDLTRGVTRAKLLGYGRAASASASSAACSGS